MVEQSAVFAWYELLTTDVSAAQSFYSKVVGWDVQDASTREFAYRLFSVGGTPVAGLMELPLDGRKKGATPRWVGYVAVEDLDGVVDQLRCLGGGGGVAARCTCRRWTATSDGSRWSPIRRPRRLP
jgi:uncharacterized protein